MRIHKIEIVDVTIEVDVTAEDIQAALAEAMTAAQNRGEAGENPLVQFANDIYKAMRGFKDDMIAQIRPHHREIIAREFGAQAERFRVPGEQERAQ
jgi:hypothetical protein